MKALETVIVTTFALLLVIGIAQACERSHWVDEMVKRGDITLTFKPNGDLSTVSCNGRKYTPLQCKNANKYVFDYYKNKKITE